MPSSEQWLPAASLPALRSANNCWPPAGRSATGLSPQRFKYLLTTWRVPNIYIGWGPPRSSLPLIGSLPLTSRSTNRVVGAVGVRGGVSLTDTTNLN